MVTEITQHRKKRGRWRHLVDCFHWSYYPLERANESPLARDMQYWPRGDQFDPGALRVYDPPVFDARGTLR